MVREKHNQHYRASIQAWDFIVPNKMSFLAGNILKYVERYDRKGTPLQDLEKALDYTNKYIENIDYHQPCEEVVSMGEYLFANQIEGTKKEIIIQLFHADLTGNIECLREVAWHIQKIIGDYDGNQK